MTLTETAILTQVASTLDDYGTSIDVLKFQSVINDQYGQGDPVFATAVAVVGRGIRKPTSEDLTVLGDGEEVEIAFLFARNTLVTAFSGSDEGEWITGDDEIGFETARYRITGVHLTGKVKDRYSLVVVVGESIPGKAGEVYP